MTRKFMEGGSVSCQVSIFVLHTSFSKVKTMLHTENYHHRCLGGGLKVYVGRCVILIH